MQLHEVCTVSSIALLLTLIGHNLNYVSDYLFQKCKSYRLELLSVFIVKYRIAKCIKEEVNTKGKC